jgi:integrative and conjugative element protein (TIGR02256 family)
LKWGNMLIFELPGNKQHLVFTNAVLSNISQYRQTHRKHPESGGQLFARITQKMVIVAAATGPHRKDNKHRFLFVPNKKRLNSEIQTFFAKGLHYVGDWHTHPQKHPEPSLLDLRSMKNCFKKSRHELEHFLLVIVGNTVIPDGIWVGLINDAHTINIDRAYVK